MATPLPFAVLISGRGSNMLAIADAVAAGGIDGRIALVLSDREDAAGLTSAAARGLPTQVIAPAGFADRSQWCQAMSDTLRQRNIGLVVLAGFMRILDANFVAQWRGRLLNIHPSLLPAYPGLHTHRRVLEAGDPRHGCTVHFVTEELDAGPAVLQGRLAVWPGDDEASLSARVQRLEHKLYPEAIAWFAGKRLLMRDGQAWLDDELLSAPVLREDS